MVYKLYTFYTKMTNHERLYIQSVGFHLVFLFGFFFGGGVNQLVMLTKHCNILNIQKVKVSTHNTDFANCTVGN